MNFATFNEPDTDQVYVSGLPHGTTEADLASHFGSIGMIKEDKQKGKLKIWLYQDKATGEMKGDGTVSYVDPFSAASAVEWFNNKEFKGAIISVSLALKGGQLAVRSGPPHNQRNSQSFERPPPPIREPPPPQRGPPQLNEPITLPPPPRSGPVPGPPPTNHMSNMSQAPTIPDEANGFLNSLQPPGPPLGHPNQGGGFPDPNLAPTQNMSHGGGGPPAPKELREGDWLCPGCGNTNFAFRGKCNRCQTPKTGGRGGGGRGRGRGRDNMEGRGGRGRGFQAAPQGPKGLFSDGDWLCPSCGNMNWARRNTCNQCNGPKPGTVDQNREGYGGGFKELDEAENEEAKRRRLENEEKNMYDEFGRLKKKFRSGQDRKAREAAALARLRGDPIPEEEVDEDVRDSGKPASEDNSKAKENDKDRHKERGSTRDRERDRDRGRVGDSHRDRDRHRDRRR